MELIGWLCAPVDTLTIMGTIRNHGDQFQRWQKQKDDTKQYFIGQNNINTET